MMKNDDVLYVGSSKYGVKAGIKDTYDSMIYDMAIDIDKKVNRIDAWGVELFDLVDEMMKSFDEVVNQYDVSVDLIPDYMNMCDEITFNEGVDLVVRDDDGNVLGVIYFNYFVSIDNKEDAKKIKSDLISENYEGYIFDDNEFLDKIREYGIEVTFGTYWDVYSGEGRENFY